MSLTGWTNSNYLKVGLSANPTAFTIMGWFYFTSFAASAGALLEAASGGDDYDLETDSGGVLHLWNNSAVSTTGTTFTLKKWYHVCMTSTNFGSGTIIPYINGVAGTSAAGGSETGTANPGFWIGQDVSVAETIGSGCFISNVKIWNGIALSAGQVRQEVYSAVPVNLRSLFGWYPLTSDDRYQRADMSGERHPLTEVGSLSTQIEPPQLKHAFPQRPFQYLKSSAGAAFANSNFLSFFS